MTQEENPVLVWSNTVTLYGQATVISNRTMTCVVVPQHLLHLFVCSPLWFEKPLSQWSASNVMSDCGISCLITLHWSQWAPVLVTRRADCFPVALTIQTWSQYYAAKNIYLLICDNNYNSWPILYDFIVVFTPLCQITTRKSWLNFVPTPPKMSLCRLFHLQSGDSTEHGAPPENLDTFFSVM